MAALNRGRVKLVRAFNQGLTVFHVTGSYNI